MTIHFNNSEPLVSIITVNYNTSQDVCDLIDSIKQNNYKNTEIIVVDNHSRKTNPSIISAQHPDIQLIRSFKNLGFAGGNNLGVKHATGEYILFINSDALLTNGCIQTLIATFTEFSDIGIVSPKFHFYNEPDKLDYAGCRKVNCLTGRGALIGHGEIDNGQYDVPKDTGYCHGGGVLVKKSILDDLGPMPEVYFLYYEELEWSENIKKSGYRVFYQPKALIYHKVSKSIGQFSTLKTYYLTRNRILFMRRNRTFFNLFIFSLYFGIISIPKNLFVHFIKGRYDHMKYFMLAVLWNIGYKKELKF